MSEKILKKPVHAVLMREDHIQQLAREGRLKDHPLAQKMRDKQPLPAEEQKTETQRVKYNVVPGGTNLVKQARDRVRLQVLHDRIPPIPADKVPPCSSCKTAACCRAFVVTLSKEEYDSGLYGDYAIEITDEMREQLQRNQPTVMILGMNAPLVVADTTTNYFLEGIIGEACPFLGSNNRCTIYETRPTVCRTYTCVDDKRITQGMRDGTEPIEDGPMGGKKKV